MRNKSAVFVPVQTGITGVTDIEVTSGLQEGDQISSGSYKALRTLRPGGKIKVDNSPPEARRNNQQLALKTIALAPESSCQCRASAFAKVA